MRVSRVALATQATAKHCPTAVFFRHLPSARGPRLVYPPLLTCLSGLCLLLQTSSSLDRLVRHQGLYVVEVWLKREVGMSQGKEALASD